MNIELQLGERLFEWDENKNRINRQKHKLDFKTAALVFNDENRKEYYDFNHSDEEDRYKVYGKVDEVLVVVYTERGVKTRIISAWVADSHERKIYYGDGDLYPA